MAAFRLFMYANQEGVHLATITERISFSDGVRRVNSPTLWDVCVSMIGRADIEGSKSNVATVAWLPQTSYPCENLSDTSRYLKYRWATI